MGNNSLIGTKSISSKAKEVGRHLKSEKTNWNGKRFVILISDKGLLLIKYEEPLQSIRKWQSNRNMGKILEEELHK